MRVEQNTPANGANATDRSIRLHSAYGMLVTIGLLGGVTGWAATSNIAGAVIANGQVVVEGNIKKVQHPEGGVVAELRVIEGQRVSSGELLARLDDKVLKSNLAILVKSSNEMMSQEARLAAERDGLQQIAFPPQLLDRAAYDPDASNSMAGQRTIFESRRTARETARNQLNEQILQMESTIVGLGAQKAARESEVVLIRDELQGLRTLYAKNLVPLSRVTALDRDRTRIEGERGKLIADIATARGSIAERRTQIAKLDDDFRSEVARDLADVRNRLNEVVEREIAARDRLSRVEIRAPASGIVHQLTAFTVGGVIANGEAIMLIVPLNEKLLVETMIDPQDIEHIHPGQKADVHFSAFSDKSIRNSEGEVVTISPDSVEDPVTRRRIYKVRLAVAPPSGADGKPLVLLPGMPAEAFIIKSSRSVLDYLLKPMADQFQRVFRS